MCNSRTVEVEAAPPGNRVRATETSTGKQGHTASTGIAACDRQGPPRREEQFVNRSIFESREGVGRGPTVRRASSQRNPRTISATRIPMRGAGGPHKFDGVLPGSEDRAVRGCALVGSPGSSLPSGAIRIGGVA